MKLGAISHIWYNHANSIHVSNPHLINWFHGWMLSSGDPVVPTVPSLEPGRVRPGSFYIVIESRHVIFTSITAAMWCPLKFQRLRFDKATSIHNSHKEKKILLLEWRDVLIQASKTALPTLACVFLTFVVDSFGEGRENYRCSWEYLEDGSAAILSRWFSWFTVSVCGGRLRSKLALWFWRCWASDRLFPCESMVQSTLEISATGE